MIPDKGKWYADHYGRKVWSNDFTHDVVLEVSGDFGSEEERIEYANWLADKLNGETK
jgi:hypothetical protein